MLAVVRSGRAGEEEKEAAAGGREGGEVDAVPGCLLFLSWGCCCCSLREKGNSSRLAWEDQLSGAPK